MCECERQEYVCEGMGGLCEWMGIKVIAKHRRTARKEKMVGGIK